MIRPSEPLKVGRMSHDEAEITATYETGRREAMARLDELKTWLKV